MFHWLSSENNPTLKIIHVDGLEVRVSFKRIKNIHLRITSPEGNVVVSAPYQISISYIESLVRSKLSWIITHQQKIKSRNNFKTKKFVEDEIHFLFDRSFRLKIYPSNSKQEVKTNGDVLDLYTKPNSSLAHKEKVLDFWYREELVKVIPEYIKKYEGVMHVSVNEFGIKKMKTRWGTCNIKSKRIWLNLELAKKPLVCLEYIVVHEMVHLLERSHNKRFKTLMDLFLPNWKLYEVELKK